MSEEYKEAGMSDPFEGLQEHRLCRNEIVSLRSQLAAERAAHSETKRELEAMTKAWNDGIEEQAKSLLRAETAERRLADAKVLCVGCDEGLGTLLEDV
jgi:hypothetical protein